MLKFTRGLLVAVNGLSSLSAPAAMRLLGLLEQKKKLLRVINEEICSLLMAR